MELVLLVLLATVSVAVKGHTVKPSITLHNGHISLYDELFHHDLQGQIRPGLPYTLDISLLETQRYDYLIQQCLYNGRSHFIDNNGCFAADGTFLKKWETTQYNIPGAVKRTIVHFVPQEPVFYVECRIKIIECCGCAEQACERRPLLSMFPQVKETLVLSVGGDHPPAGGNGVATGVKQNWAGTPPARSSGGIPWWVWLLVGLLLLFLLLMCCCAICFCCYKRRKDEKKRCMQKTSLPLAPVVPVKSPSEAPTLQCDELSASVSRAESALIATVQNPLDYRLCMDHENRRAQEENALRRELEEHLHTHSRFPTTDDRSYRGSQIQPRLSQHNRVIPRTANDETLREETERVMRQSTMIN